jgi:Tol biopolymer transport system component
MQPGSWPDAAGVRAQVEKIVASAPFRRAKRSGRLLELLVERTLAGQGDTLKEYNLALEVFERDASFDPRIDSLVRVEANRLRNRLKAYYDGEGAADSLRIELPAGGYVPVIAGITEPEPAPVPDQPPVPPRRTLPRLSPGLAAGFLCAVLAFVWIKNFRGVDARFRVSEPRRLTPAAGLAAFPSLSPDGRWFVYSSAVSDGCHLKLWSQRVEGGQPVQLTRGECDDTDGAVSPSGKEIAYQSACAGGGVFRLAASGGEPRLVANFGRGPRFSPKGGSLAYWISDPHTSFGTVWVAPAEGEPRRIAREFDDAHNPVWSADGRHLLVCGTRRTRGGAQEEHDFWLVPVGGGQATKLYAFEALAKQGLTPHVDVLPGTSLAWRGNHLFFAAQSGEAVKLWRQEIDLAAARALGAPERLYGSLMAELHPSLAGDRMAFAGVAPNVDIWSLPLDADQARVKGELARVTSNPEHDLLPAISRAAGRLAFLTRRAGAAALRSIDLRSGSTTDVSRLDESVNRLKIAPDGKAAFYRVLEGGPVPRQAIYRTEIESRRTERICNDCGAPTDVSPDGSLVIYETGTERPRLGAFHVATRQKREFLRHSHYGLEAGRISPDGQWLVFQANRGYDGKQILLARFGGAEPTAQNDWIAVTSKVGVDQEPWWSPNGRFVYFLSDRDGHRCVWAQELRGDTRQPADPPVPILHLHRPGLNPLTFLRRAPLYVGLSVAKDRLILSLAEINSSIFISDL